jgi:hypothetical protein
VVDGGMTAHREGSWSLVGSKGQDIVVVSRSLISVIVGDANSAKANALSHQLHLVLEVPAFRRITSLFLDDPPLLNPPVPHLIGQRLLQQIAILHAHKFIQDAAVRQGMTGIQLPAADPFVPISRQRL